MGSLVKTCFALSGKIGQWKECSATQMGAHGNARQSSAMHSECNYKHSMTERGSSIYHRARVSER